MRKPQKWSTKRGFLIYLQRINNVKRRIRKAVKTVRGYEAQREFYLKVAMPVLLSVLFANSLFQINRTWKIVSIHGHNFLHPNLSLRSKILSRYFFSTWENPAKLSPTLEEVPSSMALIANYENLLIMKIFDLVVFYHILLYF